MAAPLVDRIASRVADAGRLYHRLVLVVGTPRTGKTTALKELADRKCWSIVNVNLKLSEKLMELTSKQRALRVPKLLGGIVDEQSGDVVILDNIEILFSRELQQNPLRIIQGLSRNRTIIASWSGQLDGSHLTYAEPSHPEYRRYKTPDAILVPTTAAAAMAGHEENARAAEKEESA